MPNAYFGTYGHQWETFAEQTGSNAGNWACGHKLILPDTREYAFGLVDGTTATVAGSLYQSVASLADHTNKACDVLRAAGAKAISATLGSTYGAAIDIYSEGLVHVNDEDGQGYAYRIRRAIAAGDAHAAAVVDAVLTVNLEAGETVQVALVAATSEVSFSRNRFHSVIIHASPPTAQLAGVVPGIQAVSKWGWFQIKGAAAVLADGTLLEGNHAQASITTDGAVENRKIRVRTGATTAADSTIGAKATDQDGAEVSVVLMGTTISTTYDVTAGIAYNAPLVGEIIEANATTDYGLIELNLPG